MFVLIEGLSLFVEVGGGFVVGALVLAKDELICVYRVLMLSLLLVLGGFILGIGKLGKGGG